VLEKDYFELTPGHPTLEISTLMEKSIEVFEKWEDICGVTTNTPYCTGEAAWDVYWKTLYAGSYPHGDAQQTQAEFEKWHQIFRELRVLGDYGESRWEKIKNSESGTA